MLVPTMENTVEMDGDDGSTISSGEGSIGSSKSTNGSTKSNSGSTKSNSDASKPSTIKTVLPKKN